MAETTECGAIPPNVGGPVPCHLELGHTGQHFSTSGCAGSEIHWDGLAPQRPVGAAMSEIEAIAEVLAELEAGVGVESYARVLDAAGYPHGATIVREAARLAAADRDTALCRSCGEPAIHLISLNKVPTPVCLRHLNVWRTPPSDTALREAVEVLVHGEEASRFRDEACRHVVKQPFADNRYVRLLDDVRATLAPGDTGRSDA